MRALVLRLDAPLMSFGSFIVDQHGFTDLFPGRSMLTGLLANALGWSHGDCEQLNGLQSRIQFAARWDVHPERMVDYHTVDLNQPKMRAPGWTTRGVPEHRGGGQAARYGTHQRYRHFWTDGLMTVVLALRNEDSYPCIDDLYQALLRPHRPLFLGRKVCLPSRPLPDPQTPLIDGHDLLSILQQVPLWDRDGTLAVDDTKRMACWPGDLETDAHENARDVYDIRDWANQIVGGPSRRVEDYVGGAHG